MVAVLQQRLGVRLLRRTTRSMQLTDEGRTLHLHAERVLAATSWNKRRACGVLEISRPTLDRKIAEFGLTRPGGGGDDEDGDA